MGSLALPDSGIVYVDTQVLIYSIEKIPSFCDLVLPLWEASGRGRLTVATSELSLLELLVGPMKSGNEELASVYEDLLGGTEIQLFPIDREVLREAAHPRARSSLRTPDAIHAATGLSIGCALFLTNDAIFRCVDDLPVRILGDLTDQ